MTTVNETGYTKAGLDALLSALNAAIAAKADASALASKADTSALAAKVDTTSLAPVATAGTYTSLTGKPTIPATASDVGAVPTTRKVNGKALSADVTLSASDVAAMPMSVAAGANAGRFAGWGPTLPSSATLGDIFLLVT